MAHEQTKVKTSSLGTGSITTTTINDGAVTSAKIDPTATITNTKAALTATQPTYSSLTPSLADPDNATAITIDGANFISSPTVEFINTSTGAIVKSSVVSFTSSTRIVATFPTGQTAGTYKVRIENPKGVACLSTDTITYSIAPLWSTASGSLATVVEGDPISVSVLALDDDSTAVSSYAHTSGTLPAGVTLNTSTGLISGTSPLVNADTTYNFTITATDDESQQTARAFSITVNNFSVTNSCRFNDGDSAYMHKTLSGGGTTTKGTYSGWIKKCTNSGQKILFMEYESSGNYMMITFESANTIRIYGENGGSELFYLKTNALYRDPAAWMHIVVAFDSTQGTSTNRIKLYVNGVQVTSLSSTTYPSQNANLKFNQSGEIQYIGAYTGSSSFMDGYMAEICWIDGSALTPTSFGEFDSDSSTIWKPKSVSGLTFGTKGFYLDFKDSSNLGNDANGGTDLTEVNLAATDQTTDTPVNNFPTLNPLDYHRKNTTGTGALLSEGNLKFDTSSSNSITAYAKSTFGVTKGKWYWETKVIGPVAINLGICYEDYFHDATHIAPWDNPNYHTVTFSRRGDNSHYNLSGKSGDGGGDTGVDCDANDIVGWALDMDNSALYIHKNGTYFVGAGSAVGVPTSGATKTGDMLGLLHASNGVKYVNNGSEVFPSIGDSETGNSANIEVNFGNPPFTISSTNADANGYGSFEYAVPSGYFTLCSKNLAEYA